MSTLFVNKLKAAVGSLINIPSGQKLIGTDTASVYAPGMIIQCKYSPRLGAPANFTATTFSEISTSMRVTITIKQTGSLLDFQCPLYTEVDTGGGHGMAQLQYSTDGGSNWTEVGTYNVTAASDNDVGYGFSDYQDHSFNAGDEVTYRVNYRKSNVAGGHAIADNGPGETPKAYLRVMEIAQ